jgi:hypothetical protein
MLTPVLYGRFFSVRAVAVMLKRYRFEVIFTAVTLCGLVVAWALFLADGLL